MLNTASEVVYRFPDEPFKFLLRTDNVDALAPTQEPFTIEPHQTPYPRSFVHSNHVLEDVLAPTLKNWLALEGNVGEIREELMQDLLIRSLRQSLQWLSSTHCDGYVDLQCGLEAFMKIYLLPKPAVLDDPKVPESRGWNLSLSDVRVCAEAILKEDDPTSISGSPYHFTHRAVLLFSAPELLPTTMFEAIVKAASDFSVQLGENNTVVTAACDSEDEDVAKAQSWLTYVWRRLTYLQVRMAILTTTTDFLVLYINEGVIQVTDRFTPGRASDAQPIAARLPFLLAVHLLSEEDLALPQDCLNKAAAAQEHEALYSVWKKLDPSDPRPRFAGVDYTYEPTSQVPEEEDEQAVFSFDLTKMPTLASSSDAQGNPETTTESYGWKQPIGAPTVLLTAHSELQEQRLYRAAFGGELGYPGHGALFRGPIDLNKLSYAVPNLLVDSLTLKAETNQGADESDQEKKQGPKLPERIKPQHLVLEKHRWRGHNWDVYSVSAGPGAAPLPFPLVAKLARSVAEIDEPEDLPDCLSVDEEEPMHLDHDDRRRRIFAELETLHKLRELQGTVLPRVAGLWCTIAEGTETWMLLEEDVGPALTDGDLTESAKKEIRDLFTQLHQHNVVCSHIHEHDLRRGHSTAGAPDPKLILGYDEAIILAEAPQSTKDFYETREMERVDRRLGSPSTDSVPQ